MPEMWVLVMRLDLAIPGARSLKDRRQVVRSLKDRLGARFNVACAEVGRLDSWMRASLGVTAVSNEREHLRELAGEVERYARRDAGAAVGQVAKELFHYDASEPPADAADES